MTNNIITFRHLYPFRANFADMNGFQYHYLDEGAGDPMVMVHGNPTWSFYYRELVKAFSPQYRTIVPDHIGCGFSDKPDPEEYDYTLKSRVDDLENLLDSLRVTERITLIAHDWGGMISMAYALRHPERISRIILMNTAAFLPPYGSTTLTTGSSTSLNRIKLTRKRLPFRLWAIRNLTPFARPAVLGLNLFAYGALFMASYKGLSQDVKAGLIMPYDSWKNRIATLKFVQDIPVYKKDTSYDLVRYTDENLYKLAHIPMLLCWGKHDFVFDTDYLAEWQRRFPSAEAHLFSNAGHYVLEDVPDKIISHIQAFLKKYPKGVKY